MQQAEKRWGRVKIVLALGMSLDNNEASDGRSGEMGRKMRVPFNWQEYLTGAWEVETKSGVQVGRLVQNGKYLTGCAIKDGSVGSWDVQGYWGPMDSENDLVMVRREENG
jgi:hypothetical protein